MRNREHPSGSARSKNLGMHENFTCENREVPSAPDTNHCAGRLEKDVIQKSNMNADGESDSRVLPTKCPNKSGNPQAEGTEGIRLAKENTEQTTTSQTQSWNDALRGVRGVREAAKRDKRLKFTALLHHISVPLLESSFYALKREAAPGVDGMTWKEYETGLSERLTDLHSRVHRGAYRAQPSKRAYIPKEDGRQRPLGIAGFPNLPSFILIPTCDSTPDIRGKSRMQQSCPCGSVRGASGNWRPYRDRTHLQQLTILSAEVHRLCRASEATMVIGFLEASSAK